MPLLHLSPLYVCTTTCVLYLSADLNLLFEQVHEPCIVEFLDEVNHDRTPMKGVGGWERTCIVACVFTPIRTLHGSRSWDTQHLYRALESKHDFGIKHDVFVVITVIVTGREEGVVEERETRGPVVDGTIKACDCACHANSK